MRGFQERPGQAKVLMRSSPGVDGQPLAGAIVAGVMGGYRSGTKAFLDSLGYHFDVAVTPESLKIRRKALQGDVDFVAHGQSLHFVGQDLEGGTGPVWKHLPPAVRMDVRGPPGRKACLFLMVRDPLSMIRGWAKESYELRPDDHLPQHRPVNGSWLLNRVRLTEPCGMKPGSHGAFWNSPPVFENAVELMALHAYGYLQGNFTVNGGLERVFLLRLEDWQDAPAGVIAELERLGLPRNARPFKDFPEAASHDKSRTRAAAVAERPENESSEQGVFLSAARVELRKTAPLWRALGYTHVTA